MFKDDAVKVTDDINFETGMDSDRNLILTPRTEASTPESGEYTTYNICDSASIIHTSKSSKDDAFAQRSLQRHLSQTDNHIQLLDRNGDLNEVAGSQSMLSQELIDHEHDENSNERNENYSRSDISSCLLRDLGLSKGSSSSSSIGIAKRLGLLTQSQEEEEEAMDTDERESSEKESKSEPWTHPPTLVTSIGSLAQEKEKKLPQNGNDQNFDQGHHIPLKREKIAPLPESDSLKKVVEKVPLSGLDLLTQVGIKEANKLPPCFTTKKSNVNNDDNDNAISTTANPTISRENEGFGSLLDAVAKITEQEAAEELSMHRQPLLATAILTSTKSRKHPKKRKIALSLPMTNHGSASKQRKSEVQKKKERLRREKIEQENEKAQYVAKKAAMIAERTITDPVIAKKLLLSMALARENPRSVPQALPGKGHLVQEGFFWAHYPPLEFVLKKHMAEYYELSTHQCQSRQQQAFNNYMVDVVKDVAETQKWVFADSFCDKSLRDRIRCYYKTHIQNAKKRLRTMVRNPTKRANARHLCEHVDLIEQHSVEENNTETKSTLSDQKKTEK